MVNGKVSQSMTCHFVTFLCLTFVVNIEGCKEEFSDLVEVINKSAYGILGKKGLLMGKPTKNDG